MGNNRTKEHINEAMQEISKETSISTLQDIKKQTNVNDNTVYIIADSFVGNPHQLLGQIVEVRKKNGACPESFLSDPSVQFEFSPYNVLGLEDDEQTKNTKPLLRGSVVIDKNISSQTGFLNFLSASLDQKSSYSLIIMDQAVGLVDFRKPSWKESVDKWKAERQDMMNDPEICYIYVITGFVQKNVIKKKYYKFETGAKGGAYGININGSLSTSSEDYSMDIIFGLTASILKRPATVDVVKLRAVYSDIPEEFRMTNEEIELFASASGSILR